MGGTVGQTGGVVGHISCCRQPYTVAGGHDRMLHNVDEVSITEIEIGDR